MSSLPCGKCVCYGHVLDLWHKHHVSKMDDLCKQHVARKYKLDCTKLRACVQESLERTRDELVTTQLTHPHVCISTTAFVKRVSEEQAVVLEWVDTWSRQQRQEYTNADLEDVLSLFSLVRHAVYAWSQLPTSSLVDAWILFHSQDIEKLLSHAAASNPHACIHRDNKEAVQFATRLLRAIGNVYKREHSAITFESLQSFVELAKQSQLHKQRQIATKCRLQRMSNKPGTIVYQLHTSLLRQTLFVIKCFKFIHYVPQSIVAFYS